LEKQLTALLVPNSWIRRWIRYNFEGNRNNEWKEKGRVKEGRVAQKFISTYFRMQKFSINTPFQAVPGLLLLLV